jgi:ADP-heptose:LPS heptosyltransferase
MTQFQRKYPEPRLPMVGHYLVHKRYVAAGLAAIDHLCGLRTVIGNRSRAQKESNIRSILVSQCGHLGDLIMTLPALHWLRQHRPAIKIGVIVGSWAKPMLSGIAELYDKCYFADHFLLNRANLPLQEKIARHRSTWKLAAGAIRLDGYDAAVECFPFVANGIPLLYSSGVPVRAGFTSGGFGPLLTNRVVWKHASRPLLDYPRDLLSVLFDDASLARPLDAYYPAPPLAYNLPKAPYIVVQCGSGNPIKEWPDDRWTELARDLSARGTNVVIAGAGTRERERAARIQEAASGITNLCDRLSWDEFVALVAGADHVVCLDSSTSHLAAAFKVPSTVIMPGISDPRHLGPVNINARILTFQTPCAPCFRSKGCEHMACIRDISAQQAIQAVVGRL